MNSYFNDLLNSANFNTMECDIIINIERQLNNLLNNYERRRQTNERQPETENNETENNENNETETERQPFLRMRPNRRQPNRRQRPAPINETILLLNCIKEFNEINHFLIQTPQQLLQYNNIILNFTELLKEIMQNNERQRTILMDYTFEIPLTTNTRVIHGLTSEQISQTTHIVQYNNEMNENRCPITIEPFIIGEDISQINVCLHIFKTNALTNWLQHHTTCPVCRCSLTHQPDPPPQPLRQNELLESQFLQNILRNILTPNEPFSFNINNPLSRMD